MRQIHERPHNNAKCGEIYRQPEIPNNEVIYAEFRGCSEQAERHCFGDCPADPQIANIIRNPEGLIRIRFDRAPILDPAPERFVNEIKCRRCDQRDARQARRCGDFAKEKIIPAEIEARRDYPKSNGFNRGSRKLWRSPLHLVIVSGAARTIFLCKLDSSESLRFSARVKPRNSARPKPRDPANH